MIGKPASDSLNGSGSAAVAKATPESSTPPQKTVSPELPLQLPLPPRTQESPAPVVAKESPPPSRLATYLPRISPEGPASSASPPPRSDLSGSLRRGSITEEEKPNPRALALLSTPSIMADMYEHFENELEMTSCKLRRGDHGEVDALLRTLHGQSSWDRSQVSLEAVCLARVMDKAERTKQIKPQPWSMQSCSGGAEPDFSGSHRIEDYFKFGQSSPARPAGEPHSGHGKSPRLERFRHVGTYGQTLRSDTPPCSEHAYMDPKLRRRAQQRNMQDDRAWTGSSARRLSSRAGFITWCV